MLNCCRDIIYILSSANGAEMVAKDVHVTGQSVAMATGGSVGQFPLKSTGISLFLSADRKEQWHWQKSTVVEKLEFTE